MSKFNTITIKTLIALFTMGGPLSGCNVDGLIEKVNESIETEDEDSSSKPNGLGGGGLNGGGTSTPEGSNPIDNPSANSSCEENQYCTIESDDQASEAAATLWGVVSTPDCWRADDGEGLIQITFGGDTEYEFIYASDPSSGSAEMHESGEVQFSDMGTYNSMLTGVVQTFTSSNEFIVLESETSMIHSIELDGEVYNMPYQATNDCY